jgi:hypothetical protein
MSGVGSGLVCRNRPGDEPRLGMRQATERIRIQITAFHVGLRCHSLGFGSHVKARTGNVGGTSKRHRSGDDHKQGTALSGSGDAGLDPRHGPYPGAEITACSRRKPQTSPDRRQARSKVDGKLYPKYERSAQEAWHTDAKALIKKDDAN